MQPRKISFFPFLKYPKNKLARRSGICLAIWMNGVCFRPQKYSMKLIICVPVFLILRFFVNYFHRKGFCFVMLFVQNVLLSIILIFILVLSFLNRTRHNLSFVGFWIKGPMFPFFYASKFAVLSPSPSPKHATFAQTKTLDEARRGANLLFPPILSFVPSQDPQLFLILCLCILHFIFTLNSVKVQFSYIFVGMWSFHHYSRHTPALDLVPKKVKQPLLCPPDAFRRKAWVWLLTLVSLSFKKRL